MIRAERNARVMAEANAAVVKAEAANAQADLSSSEALNAHLKLEIEKLRSPIISRASASSSPHQKAVPAAARRNCRSWARTLPKRWR